MASPAPARLSVWRDPAWQIVGFLWVCYLLNHADRQVVYTLFPLLQKELFLSDAALGLTGGLFSWVYGLCSPLAGYIGDRFSQRRLVVGSVAVWSLFTIVTGLATSGTFLLVCRALLGISEAMFMPAAYALMANAHSPATRSRAIAAFGTSQLLGVSLSGSLGGAVAEYSSWRIPFFFLGALGILYAVPLGMFLARLPDHLRLDQTATSAKDAPALPFAVLRIPTFLVMCACSAIGTFSLFLVYAWLPTFLYDKFGLSLSRAGVEATIYIQIGSALGLLAAGTLADYWFRRAYYGRMAAVALGLALSAPALFWLGAAPTLFWTRPAAFLFGFFAAFMPANQAACCFDVVPARLRASTIGMINLLGAGLAGCGPYLGGLSRNTIGVARLMTFTAILMLIAALLTIVGTKLYTARDQKRVAVA